MRQEKQHNVRTTKETINKKQKLHNRMPKVRNLKYKHTQMIANIEAASCENLT